MDTMVCHYWVGSPDGKLTLYEADYSSYPIREAVLGLAMVSHSERPCSCPERDVHERRLASALA